MQLRYVSEASPGSGSAAFAFSCVLFCSMPQVGGLSPFFPLTFPLTCEKPRRPLSTSPLCLAAPTRFATLVVCNRGSLSSQQGRKRTAYTAAKTHPPRRIQRAYCATANNTIGDWAGLCDIREGPPTPRRSRVSQPVVIDKRQPPPLWQRCCRSYGALRQCCLGAPNWLFT